MAQDLTIGRVARATNVTVETIRYYQRRGLLGQPAKPPSGRRHYSTDVVRQVLFIKRAQHLGFTLQEIKGLLRLDDGKSCSQTRVLAEEKLAVIERRLADLSRVRRLLRQLIAECETVNRRQSCPIIVALSN
jgi:MerR family mercuric resistance operon transcriptional regulator